MIESLHLEGIAVVQEAALEFGPGLNVLTGETGAGKSIVLGALSLILGGRARADVLRQGCETGRVEAVFAVPDPSGLGEALASQGFDREGLESGSVVVSRLLSREGKSRARVAGQLVPASVLVSLFSEHVEIASQRESQALLRPENHGRALDAAGGLLDERAEVAHRYAALVALDAEAAALREGMQQRLREQDFLRFQCDEIDAADLSKIDWDQVDQEHRRLAHAQHLRAEGGSAVVAVEGDPGAGGEGAALDALWRSAKILEGLGPFDSEVARLGVRMAAAATDVREVLADLERHLDGIDADPTRLQRVEEKLAVLETLKRKYGNSVDEILAYRERIGAELDELDDREARAQEIDGQREREGKALAKAAARLSKGRAATVQPLASQLERALRELGMPDACFRVELEARCAVGGEATDLRSGPLGAETPVFCFSANADVEPRPIQKVASGGELSRLFLALKNVLRRETRGMVLVFDEIDTGVGGGVAEQVGRVLKALSQHHQVLCITHLPQIAALADVHFRVVKRRHKGRTETAVEFIDGEERVEEIARMAGGKRVTEATRRHARELLGAR